MPLIHLLALYGICEMSEESKLNYSHLGEILSVCKTFGSKIHENSKSIKMIQQRKVGVEDNGDEGGVGDKYHQSIFMKQFYEDIPPYSAPLSSGSPHAARLVSRAQSEKEEEDYDYCPEEEDCKKTILVGSQHQAVIPEGLCKYDDALPYENEDKLLWDPSSLTADQIENYLLKAQEPLAGNNAHNISSVRADFHKRDDEQALYLLLQCGYNVEEALRRRRMNVVAPTDTMSLWSEEECRNFENGLRTYGKNFHLIQQNKVRTRSVGELVQFYYLWKKTERHDTFANKAKYEKKKYTLHPGITDFMDRFLEEQESGGGSSGCGNTTNNNSQRDRSSSPNIQCLIYGDRKRHHRSDKTPDHLSKDSVLISSSVAYFSIKDGAGPSSEISESGVRISESNFIVPRIVNSDLLSEERSIIKK